MDPLVIAGLLATAAVAAYVQTVTGFAFGLVTMGTIGLTGLMPLPHAAVVVSMLTLTNAGFMLAKGWRHVARREIALILAGSLPTLLAGYALLDWLAGRRTDLLEFILGAIIILSSLQLAVRPEPLPRRSGDPTFLLAGVVSGFMSGLFAIGGPPLIWHLYRQPLPLASIRETLVTAFGIAALVRLAVVGGAGDMPAEALPALVGIPVVMASTAIARRWPPPLPPRVLRRIVFVLLFLSGLSLAWPAAVHLATGAAGAA